MHCKKIQPLRVTTQLYPISMKVGTYVAMVIMHMKSAIGKLKKCLNQAVINIFLSTFSVQLYTWIKH